MKISIAVPVYNVEKYISKCIESLLSQTQKDIEIILVDDGSTDNSGLICDDYAQKDKRIRVIHKQNGGLGAARQSGLEVASGDYFCICDADDWVEPAMYEELCKKAIETGADIVMCDYVAEYGNGERRVSHYGREITESNGRLVDMTLNGFFPCSVWRKMYKREVFDKYNLSWMPGINMGEDFLITLRMLQYPVKIAYLPMVLYHYRRMPGENSYTNKVTLNSYNQMLRIQEWIETHLDKQIYQKGINHYLINIAFAGLRVVDGMTADYYKQTSIKRLGITCLFKERSLKAIVIIWTKILGYRAGVALYKLMYKRIYK